MKRRYFVVPAVNGEVVTDCACYKGAQSGDGSQRVVRCVVGHGDHLAEEPGVVELTHMQAMEKSQDFYNQGDDAYVGIS